MNKTDTDHLPFSARVRSLAWGVVFCFVVAVVLVMLGFAVMEAYVFASLGGLAVSCFVWIERGLLTQVKEKDKRLAVEIEFLQDTQGRLYSRSLACFVRFHADTLIIDQSTPGFIRMLRMSVDSVLRGKRLDDVLGVDPLKLQSVVDSVMQGDSSVDPPKLDIINAEGYVTRTLVNGEYIQSEHLVEAAFFALPVNSAERMADLEAAEKDLDRFRVGMFRRETRILELKEELNIVCRSAGLPLRYQTDKSSDDSKLEPPIPSADKTDTGKGLIS